MILDKKSSMEWTNCDHHITMNIILRPQKISFPFDRFLSIFLIIWSLDAASVSIYVNVLKWRPAAPSSEYLTHSLAAPAAPRIDLPKIEEHRGDPRYIFAAQDVSGGGRRYIRGNLLVGKTRKIWKGCRWFDWDGELFTIYYLFSALWTRTSRNPWEMWHQPLSFASLKE